MKPDTYKAAIYRGIGSVEVVDVIEVRFDKLDHASGSLRRKRATFVLEFVEHRRAADQPYHHRGTQAFGEERIGRIVRFEFRA